MDESSIDINNCEIANIDDVFNVTNFSQVSVNSSSGNDNEKEPINNHQYHLDKLERDLSKLTKERRGKMENFTLHLYHSSTNEHFDSLQSDDLCAIIEKYKKLDVKIYFDKKTLTIDGKRISNGQSPNFISKGYTSEVPSRVS